MELHVLEEAALRCGEIIVKLREEGVTATDKSDVRGTHFSTQADEQSQTLGISIIHKYFPEEVIVAEEQDYLEAVPKNCTVFDPLDGTTLYFNGAEEFGVTFCTLRDGKPLMGVIYIPMRDILLTCERGKGVLLNGQPLPALRWNKPMDKTMIGMEIGPWMDLQADIVPVAGGLLADGFPLRGIWAAISDATAVLRQEMGAYVHLGLGAAKIWDAAAGSLMIQELGGVAVDLKGSPLIWDKVHMSWVWAANQELADAVLKHTKQWPGRG